MIDLEKAEVLKKIMNEYNTRAMIVENEITNLKVKLLQLKDKKTKIDRSSIYIK